MLTRTEISTGIIHSALPRRPSEVEQGFARRFAGLAPGARQLLLVAAAEPFAEPWLVWGAAARLGLTLDDLAPAVEAGLGEAGTAVRFTHPLVRSAVYYSSTADETFSGTRITDPEVLHAQEPLLAQLTAAGFELAAAVDALDLTTAFVVGFVIEEQEQRQSAEADPARYSLAERDERLGDEVPLVKAAGHVRDHGAERFERHLRTLLAGVAAGREQA